MSTYDILEFTRLTEENKKLREALGEACEALSELVDILPGSRLAALWDRWSALSAPAVPVTREGAPQPLDCKTCGGVGFVPCGRERCAADYCEPCKDPWHATPETP